MYNNTASIKKYGIIAGLVLTAFFLLVFLFSNSILIVSTSAKNDDSLISATKIGSDKKPKQLKKGVNILPTGTYSVAISSGISLTKKDVNINPFRVKKFDATPSKQLQATKIARTASECVFGNKDTLRQGQVFSYDCIEPPVIFKNTQGEKGSQKNIATNITSTYKQTIPYGDSIVSLLFTEGGVQLSQYKDGGDIIYDLSEQNGFKQTNSYLLSVTGKLISLLDYENNIVYQTDGFGNKFKNYPFDSLEKLGDNVSFQATEERFYILSASADQDHGDSFDQGFFSIYKLGDKEPLTSIETGDLTNKLIDFDVINKESLVSLSPDKTMTIFKVNNDSLRVQDSLLNVDNYTINTDQLYIVNDGNVYRYDPFNKTQVLVFGSAKIRITKLQSIDGLVVMNGYSNTETNAKNQTYILEDDELNQTTRIEDTIPYGDIDSPVEYMDYFGNNFYIVLPLDSIRRDLTKSSGYTYDQEEYNSALDKINTQLAADGFTRDKYNIQIFPY